MARGPRKHMKRLNAPRHWMLDKLSGKWAPRPSTGPHPLRECLPLVIFLRNRLNYALSMQEVKSVVNERLIKVDGKVRTDPTYPAGLMDVISIERTNEHFRLLYDTKGRFTVHRITPEEASYKLCKVKRAQLGDRGVPYIATHDGRTIRYPNPDIKVNDTVKVELADGSVSGHLALDLGKLVIITGGHSVGRVGTLVHRERHEGSFDIVFVKDAAGNQFATRQANIFVIGEGKQPWVSLPRGKGVKLAIEEDRKVRMSKLHKA